MKVREDPSWGIEGTCWIHQASLTSNELVPATCPGEENDMTHTDQTISATFICQILPRHTNISCPKWETMLSTHLFTQWYYKTCMLEHLLKVSFRILNVKYMHLISFQAQIWTHRKNWKEMAFGCQTLLYTNKSEAVHEENTVCLICHTVMYQKIGPRSHVIFAICGKPILMFSKLTDWHPSTPGSKSFIATFCPSNQIWHLLLEIY